jgi:hypothetical protein
MEHGKRGKTGIVRSMLLPEKRLLATKTRKIDRKILFDIISTSTL